MCDILIFICGFGDLASTKAHFGHLRSYISVYASQWKPEYMSLLSMFKLRVQSWSIFSLDSENGVFSYIPYWESELVEEKPIDSSI